MKQRLIHLLIYLLPLTVVASSAQYQNIAEVVFKLGKVSLLTVKGQKDIHKGDKLDEGAVVVTGKRSIALIRVSSPVTKVTSMIKVNQNSTVKIRIERRVPLAHLSVGSLVVKVFSLKKDKKSLKLKVQSKVAAIGVRGTEFFVYAETDKQMTTLHEGQLEMVGAHSSHTLKFPAGISVATNEAQQLIQPKKFSWQQKINWSTDVEDKDLLQPEEIFSMITASWEKYKKEQEFRYKEYTKDMENRLNNWNEDNDKLRKSIFGN